MQRIPSLDGLRAISITMVVLGHLVKWKHISADFLGNYGTMGVHIFFVLSGYLITNLLLREYERSSTISLRDFYIRRAFRIFPAALVFLAIVTVLYWHELRWYQVTAALFYVANMVPSRPWIIGHLWSLSIEEQFYLLWPFALKQWHRHKTAILLCVFLAAPVFRAALYAFRVDNGIVGSLPVYADQLAIGCLLAIFAPRLPRIRGYFALLMVAVIILGPWLPANSAPRTVFRLFLLNPLLNISIAGVVLHVIQVPYRAPNWAPVAWLGKVSYSLYLWQEPFCSDHAWKHGFALALLSLGCATLSHYLVEQPMLRLREKLFRTPAPTPRPEAETATHPPLPLRTQDAEVPAKG